LGLDPSPPPLIGRRAERLHKEEAREREREECLESAAGLEEGLRKYRQRRVKRGCEPPLTPLFTQPLLRKYRQRKRMRERARSMRADKLEEELIVYRKEEREKKRESSV